MLRLETLFELLSGTLAVGVLLVGLQTIGTILAVALDTDDLFFLALGMAVALAVSGAVLWLMAFAAALTLTPIATGWLGMAVGRHPYGYGLDDANLPRALGNVLLIVIFSWWGHGIWARAIAVGDHFWAVTGMFVSATGCMIGLLALAPRLYFGLHPGEAESESTKKKDSHKSKKADDGETSARAAPLHEQANSLVIGLTVCLMAGIGLARCTAQTVADPSDDEGRVVLPYGDWVFACVDRDPTKEGCSDPALFTIRPRGDLARRIRLTLGNGCPEVHVEDDSGHRINPVGDEERARLNIPPNGRGGLEHDYLIFDSRPKEQYTIVMSSGAKDSCRAALRYGVEPTSEMGRVQ